MVVSVTRLRVRSWRHVPAFLWYTFVSQRQVVRAAGFSGGRLLIDARRTFWTLTAWEDERAMKAFRGTGAHARVMPRLFDWCDEAAYAHWTLPMVSFPIGYKLTSNCREKAASRESLMRQMITLRGASRSLVSSR
jgi:hypothetical protein